MAKLDDLKRAAGGNIAESASRRYEPVITPTAAASAPARMEGVTRSKAALEIPLEKIERDPGQPREEFDEDALSRLADSIRARGLLQPVRVRWAEGRGKYLLIAGERRWRAAAMAGLSTLTCVVADGELSPAELLAVQVTENLLREDLRPVERAKAFRTLMELNSWSGNQLSKELGISQSSVVHALSLLELPEPLQERVESGDLAPSVGYELSKLGDAGAQADVAERIVAGDMSRDRAIDEVRRAAGRAARGGKGRGGKARKVTSRVFRTPAGRVTVENGRGLDPDQILEALAAVAEQVRAEVELRSKGEAA